MTTSGSGWRQARPALVGLTAAVLVLAFVVTQLADADWDVTFFTAFGEEATEIRDYAESRLGEVTLRPQLGHDGRFFFVQANDPWVLEPETNAVVLDRPAYRSQRMFYPLIAGGLGAFGPEVIVWALLAVNVVAMGLGSWAVASIATAMHRSPWWGLAFVLNIGFVSELNISGAGIVAAAAAFGAVASIMRGRLRWGIALLVVAALSREVMLVVAAGAAWWLWQSDRRREAVLTAVIPAAAVGAWAAYLRLGAGLASGLSEVQEIGLPFVGLVQAFRTWLGDPIDMIVGVAVIAVLALFTWRALLNPQLIGWAFLGLVVVSVLLTEQVWHSYFDITRGVAPVITAYVLLVAIGSGERSRGPSGDAIERRPSRFGK